MPVDAMHKTTTLEIKRKAGQGNAHGSCFKWRTFQPVTVETCAAYDNDPVRSPKITHVRPATNTG